MKVNLTAQIELDKDLIKSLSSEKDPKNYALAKIKQGIQRAGDSYRAQLLSALSASNSNDLTKVVEIHLKISSQLFHALSNADLKLE